MQILILAFLMLLPAANLLAADESCRDCHREKTPFAFQQWQQSAHRPVGVGCSDCHGTDHDKILGGKSPVDATVCGRCHETEYNQHVGSRHGMGLHAGWGCTRNQSDRDPKECLFCHEEGSTLPVSTVQCARFLKQSSEMGALGCNRCHQVENNCASCHSNHLTSPTVATDPKICAKCHMGPDHPQWEMWETSLHGTLFYSAGPDIGPSCQRCHMPDGSHDVSAGLTAPPSMKPYPEAELPERRETMVATCRQCHAADFARKELAAADRIREQSLAIADEAVAIVQDLNDRNLLDPPPGQRPAHPQRGHKLVTDGQMLYEDYSHVERLLFKLKKFSLAKTVKGAYHQNPAYTHWYGNAELKMDLVDIKAEASRLLKEKRDGAATEKPAPAKQGIDEALQLLKKRFDRGALDEEGYRQAKEELLRKYLGK